MILTVIPSSFRGFLNCLKRQIDEFNSRVTRQDLELNAYIVKEYIGIFSINKAILLHFFSVLGGRLPLIIDCKLFTLQ